MSQKLMKLPEMLGFNIFRLIQLFSRHHLATFQAKI